jgi:hypothetical protein
LKKWNKIYLKTGERTKMLKLAKKSKLSPEETIKRAVAFFGPGGLGMKITEQTPTCAYFRGIGESYVNVTTCVEEKGTSVEVESREWDKEAKEFMAKIR